MILQDHVRVSREEDDQVHLLSAVGQPNDVLIGYNLQEQHQNGNQMQEVAHQLKYIHFNISL